MFHSTGFLILSSLFATQAVAGPISGPALGGNGGAHPAQFYVDCVDKFDTDRLLPDGYTAEFLLCTHGGALFVTSEQSAPDQLSLEFLTYGRNGQLRSDRSLEMAADDFANLSLVVSYSAWVEKTALWHTVPRGHRHLWVNLQDDLPAHVQDGLFDHSDLYDFYYDWKDVIPPFDPTKNIPSMMDWWDSMIQDAMVNLGPGDFVDMALALLDALTSDDVRMEDEDGDGINNAIDEDYEGPLWEGDNMSADSEGITYKGLRFGSSDDSDEDDDDDDGASNSTDSDSIVDFCSIYPCSNFGPTSANLFGGDTYIESGLLHTFQIELISTAGFSTYVPLN
jgi:hypothetical protein